MSQTVYHYDFYRNEFEDIFDWIRENIPKEHLVKWVADEMSVIAVRHLKLPRYRVRISIDNEKSAMLFKLRWGNAD